MDAHENFAYARVAVAPSPADSGTTLDIVLNADTILPSAPFDATVWPDGVNPVLTNAEIVRVTDWSGATLTIERGAEGSVVREIQVGDQIAATITKKTLTDVEENSLRAAGPFTAVVMPSLWPSHPEDIQVFQFPDDRVAFAFGIEGDVYPRWVFMSDPGDGLYVSDGTFNPFDTGANLELWGGGVHWYTYDPDGYYSFRCNSHELRFHPDGTLTIDGSPAAGPPGPPGATGPPGASVDANGLVAGGLVSGHGGSGLIDLPNNSPEFHNEQLVARIDGLLFTMPANTVVGLTGDSANPRIDAMVVTSPGVFGPAPGWDTFVVLGTPAPSPVRPTLPSNEIPLAWIDVPANATTSTQCTLTDARVFVGYVPVDATGHVRFCGMTSALADGDLTNSEFGLWLDDNPGAPTLKIKAKDSAGTVRTATVPLS